MTELTLIIPTLGDSPQLVKLLESITQQVVNFNFEVIIVDNSQKERVHEALRKLQEQFKNLSIRLFHIEERGVNFARNRGLLESYGRILFFVDDDCWFKDVYLLKKHVQFHQKNPDLFAVGGLYRLGETPSFLDRCYHLVQMRWLYEGRNPDGYSRHLIGGHFSIKKALSDKYQLKFNESIVYGGSELGFFLQSYRAGLKMKLETLDIIHETHIDFKSLTTKVVKQGRGKARLDQELVPLDQSTQFVEIEDFSHRLVIYYLNLVFQYGYLKEIELASSAGSNSVLLPFKIVIQIFLKEIKYRRDMIIRWLDQSHTRSKKDL